MSTSKDIINYTDTHDVDEDTMTISVHCGNWDNGNMAGIVQRVMHVPASHVSVDVASRRNITQHDS